MHITMFIPNNMSQNHAHVKEVGTPQNLFLAFIDELEKTTIN